MARKKEDQVSLSITHVHPHVATIPVIGITPLLCNAFGQERKLVILNDQTSKIKLKPPRQPAAEVVKALYQHEGVLGVPAQAFKSAIVNSCKRVLEGIPGTQAKLLINVLPDLGSDLVRIWGRFATIRCDRVRNFNGVLDLRFRPQFWPWGAQIQVSYVKPPLILETVVNVLNAAGLVGIGDWRPEMGGTFGSFRVAASEEWEEFARQYPDPISVAEVATAAQQFESELSQQIMSLQGAIAA